MDAPIKDQDKAIVMTIAQLAQNLKMNVVAEGVETVEQYQLLKTIIGEGEHNQIQGFLFSKPILEAELAKVTNKIKHEWSKINSYH